MSSTRHRLGELIEPSDQRNSAQQYTVKDVRGISIQKEFIATKADMSGVSLRPYKLVKPGEFAYVTVTSRNGNKITLAHNTTQQTYIVSSSYEVFKIKDCAEIIDLYLFMYFNRPEFDRYARFNSWGSARETFSWADLCDSEIVLPSLHVQQRFVEIYRAMVENQHAYERGVDDLERSYELQLDRAKHSERVQLHHLITEVDERNHDLRVKTVTGINKDKQLIPSRASGANLSRYKVVTPGQFACNLMHVGRDYAVPISLNDTGAPILVSPAYLVFECSDPRIHNEFLMSWFSRAQSDRYAWYVADTSIRSGLEKVRFLETEIPLPSLNLQRSIANLSTVYRTRRVINEKLKAQIKRISPILINGSLNSAFQMSDSLDDALPEKELV